MGNGSTGNIPQYRHPGIGIAFTGQNTVTQRAAANKGGRQTYQGHTQEIPEVVSMGYRLVGKAPVIDAPGTEVTGSIIGYDSRYKKGR
jgi:hypothetical protein